MSPTDAVHVLQVAIVAVGGLAALLWRLPGPCVCEKCAFHTNERRMAALLVEEKRQADIALAHDADHKGFGFKAGAADIRDCADEACSRNKMRVE